MDYDAVNKDNPREELAFIYDATHKVDETGNDSSYIIFHCGTVKWAMDGTYDAEFNV